ncbi:MAG: hypothetical protein CMM10_10635 [Rhodospirillaceae bacterium]|jgi:hypothetical protein|nr:hypothetical protein [Rhodospirillaceae bacterium]MDP6644883.1 hypothetical protein [Rhodospirillales bacterium]|tara:strand:- start:1274 stop:1699 length:426 start_codon:yes stop_codon:yes gene_type:complete
MNRILGPDKSAPLWYAASSRRGDKRGGYDDNGDEPRSAPEYADGEVTLNVSLFGYLETIAAASRLTLRLPASAKASDAIEAIGKASGLELAAELADGKGDFKECFRIFVDGVLRKDLDAAINPANGPAEVEIILLMANEAG